MDLERQKALEAEGWRFGDAADFLGMTDEERRLLDARFSATLEGSLTETGLPLIKGINPKKPILGKDLWAMQLTREQQQLRERYVIALIEATHPFQKEAVDREVTLELLIQAAGSLKKQLEKELQRFREETD